MNKVMTIPEARYARDMEAFFPLFHTPEIKARRAERMRQAQQQAQQQARQAIFREGYNQGYNQARYDGENRERALIKAKDQEAASLAADVAGGFTMAAALVAIAMMV